MITTTVAFYVYNINVMALSVGVPGFSWLYRLLASTALSHNKQSFLFIQIKFIHIVAPPKTKSNFFTSATSGFNAASLYEINLPPTFIDMQYSLKKDKFACTY